MSFTLVTVVICFSYLVESVFGFGGTIIALSILGFFFDFKEVIPLVIYASVISSSVICVSDPKSINIKILKRIFPYICLGTLMGVCVFYVIPSELLLKIFALFILYNSLKSLLAEKLIANKAIKNFILVLSGVMQGIFGTGGPMALVALKGDFASKSELRATMAVFFIVLNIIRVTQLYFFTDFPVMEIFQIWWLIVPLSISILLGYKIHLSVNEKVFNKALSVLLLFTAIIFLIK